MSDRPIEIPPEPVEDPRPPPGGPERPNDPIELPPQIEPDQLPSDEPTPQVVRG